MDRARAGYIEGFVSIIVNILLFGLKLWAGIVTGSIALTADAWHTLSDSVSSVVVVAGVRLSSRKPDRDHPFGHGRWEQIAALIIAFILGVIAWDFMKESVIRFTERESVQFGTLAIVATVVSIIVKEALARFAFYIGRKTDNVTVKADGWHHRSDALSSVVVLAGIFISKYFWWIDSLLGAIISLMLFYATYKIAREAIDKLLGEKPSPELIKDITDLIEKNYGDNIQPHHFHIHNYVAHQELTFHIKLDKHLNIKSGHDIATDIETRILDKMGIIATVHVEPVDFEHESD
jgi:cation diffusion facilitator family transporter